VTISGAHQAVDAVSAARRSMLGVRTPASSGSGWVALGNGLLMTSHEAVGFEATVELLLDGGRHREGRVVWVDVARDLALVMPTERLSLPPLFPRPDLPRLGEPVLALSAVPDGPFGGSRGPASGWHAGFRVLSATVSAIDVRVGQLRCFELDAPVPSRGGPIIDLDGRLIGIGGLDLPRGARRTTSAEAARSVAIPIAALSRALAAVDVAPQQFEGRVPTYRCPACNEPFSPRDDRCKACGRLLPHAWSLRDPSGRSAPAERLVQEWAAELGPTARVSRTSQRSFRLTGATEEGAAFALVVDVDGDGSLLSGRMPVTSVPTVNLEPFYRFLLSWNDQAPGSGRFSIEDDTVFLSFAVPTSFVRPGEGPSLVRELARDADRFKKTLRESFDLEAIE